MAISKEHRYTHGKIRLMEAQRPNYHFEDVYDVCEIDGMIVTKTTTLERAIEWIDS